jgi:hypothetical protein
VKFEPFFDQLTLATLGQSALSRRVGATRPDVAGEIRPSPACPANVADGVACNTKWEVCGPVGTEFCACYIDPSGYLVWDCDDPRADGNLRVLSAGATPAALVAASPASARAEERSPQSGWKITRCVRSMT